MRDDYPAGTGTVAAIVGHPLHPMLVPVVIGAFVAVVIADIMHLRTADLFWGRCAAWLLLLTVIASVVAALPGAIDLLSLPRARTMPLAWAHGAGNVLFLVLAIINWLSRGADGAATSMAFILTFVGLALLGVTGWIGGELSFRHGIGVARSVGGGSRSAGDIA